MSDKVFAFTALTGGGTAALDSIDGDLLYDKNIAVGVVSGITYTYYLDDDSALAESSPNVITPDTNPGNKRWILSQKEYAVTTQAGFDALASIAANTNVVIYPGSYTVSADMTIPAYVNMEVKLGALITIATTKTLTISGIFSASNYQVFSCVGTGVIAGLKYAKADWFGVNTSPGTTDMTTIINKAGAAVSAGGTLSFLPTTYYINTAGGVTFSSKIKIEGNGAAFTTGTTVGNAPTLTFPGADSEIEGIKVTGDSTGWTRTDDLSTELRRNIKLSGHRIKLRNCEVAEGIVGVEVSGNDADISGCYIHHTTVISGYADDTNYNAGIYVNGGSRTSIHDKNYVLGYGQNILIGSDAMGVKVTNNDLASADDNGVYISSGTYCIVSGNRVVGYDNSGIKPRGSYHIVNHNIIRAATAGAAGSGVTVTGNGTPTGNWNGYGTIVQGNMISGKHGASAAGIKVDDQDSGYMKDPQILDNWISITTTGYGISLTGAGDGGVVKGNVIEGHTIGLRVAGDTGSSLYFDNMLIANNKADAGTDDNSYLTGVRYSTIDGNMFRNAASGKDGMKLTYCTYSRFANNDCRDTQGSATQRYGINESTGCSANEFYNNNMTGNATLPMVVTGTNSMVVPGITLTLTLSGNYSMRPGAASVYLVDPGGSHRNFNPSGTYPAGYTVQIVNTADNAENLVFDSTALNVTVAQNKSCIFVYTGSAWRQMTAVAP